jgi:hypothetical protein
LETRLFDLEPLQPLEIPQNRQSISLELLAEKQAEFGKVCKKVWRPAIIPPETDPHYLCAAVILATFLDRASTLARGATRDKADVVIAGHPDTGHARRRRAFVGATQKGRRRDLREGGV